jgi:hypothetical protein
MDQRGKYRVPVALTPVSAAPIEHYFVLDPQFDEVTPLSGTRAVDVLLSRPYSRAAAGRGEAQLRLQCLVTAVGQGKVTAIPPKIKPASELAQLVLEH